ncbi:MAG TPA: hypothetical protein VLM89_07805 [Phycisphaerae bacterium]|nr:hypothetical protein [Phycisphaerae bacterium]
MTTDEVVAKIAAEEAQFQARMDEQVVDGFKVGDMRKVFERLVDPKDWRGPIAALIAPGLFPIAKAAVEFYTATELKVVGGPEQLTGRVAVHSVGYRMGPAGDH